MSCKCALISRASSASARPARKKESRRNRKRRTGAMSGLSQQKLVHEPHEPAPLLRLPRQLALAGLGDRVVLRLPIALRLLPLPLDPPLLLQADQRGIE